MKIWTSEHTFNYPWDHVAAAAQRKYPNPLNPYVVGVDVVDRHVDRHGILRSHRLIHTSWSISEWAQRLIGNDRPCYASEHSACDPVNKTLVLRSRNLTFCNVISIDETLSYSQHPTDKKKTVLNQEAKISVYGVPLSSYCEGLLETNMSSTAVKGRSAIEFVIHQMQAEKLSL